jgi:lysozyme
MPYPQNMTTQAKGRALIKKREKISQKAYHLQDEKYWTIGYGHNGADVHQGMFWSVPQCEKVFNEDVKKHERFKTQVKVPLNQNQFDALSSFSYNLGGLYNTNGTKTTLLIMLNKGNYKGASKQMMRFVYPIQFKKGLTIRRIDERKLFDTPVTEKEPVKTAVNQKAVENAKAQKQADAKQRELIAWRLRKQDLREQQEENNAINKAKLTRNKQTIAIAQATAKANATARANAQKVEAQNKLRQEKINKVAEQNAYKSKNPVKPNIGQPKDAQPKKLPVPSKGTPKVIRSGISIIGLFLIALVMYNVEIPETSIE